jgi:hypothetical protein
MRNAEQVVEQEFLVVRSKILEIAAFFDRLDDEQKLGASSETRLNLLREGCQILLDDDDDKAARVQLLFSRQFDPKWRSTMQV